MIELTKNSVLIKINSQNPVSEILSLSNSILNVLTDLELFKLSIEQSLNSSSIDYFTLLSFLKHIQLDNLNNHNLDLCDLLQNEINNQPEPNEPEPNKQNEINNQPEQIKELTYFLEKERDLNRRKEKLLDSNDTIINSLYKEIEHLKVQIKDYEKLLQLTDKQLNKELKKAV